jgi:hypothetical protein
VRRIILRQAEAILLVSFQQEVRGQGAISSKGELPPAPLLLSRCGAISVTVPHAQNSVAIFRWEFTPHLNIPLLPLSLLPCLFLKVLILNR